MSIREDESNSTAGAATTHVNTIRSMSTLALISQRSPVLLAGSAVEGRFDESTEVVDMPKLTELPSPDARNGHVATDLTISLPIASQTARACQQDRKNLRVSKTKQFGRRLLSPLHFLLSQNRLTLPTGTSGVCQCPSRTALQPTAIRRRQLRIYAGATTKTTPLLILCNLGEDYMPHPKKPTHISLICRSRLHSPIADMLSTLDAIQFDYISSS
jgi:hypothetical protein